MCDMSLSPPHRPHLCPPPLPLLPQLEGVSTHPSDEKRLRERERERERERKRETERDRGRGK